MRSLREAEIMQMLFPNDRFQEPTGDNEKFIHWCCGDRKGHMPKLQLKTRNYDVDWNLVSHLSPNEPTFILNADVTGKNAD